MTNTNAITGIRFGVISLNSLDPDVANDLWVNGHDESYAEALVQLRSDVNEKADALEEQVYEDYPNLEPEDLALRVEAMWLGLGYSSRDDYIDAELEKQVDTIQIDEPHIVGEHDGVTYQITWLGGAPLLWALEGPTGLANRLCSPCVPNAADLDGGFVLEEEVDAMVDAHVDGASPDAEELNDGYFCYVVPRDWLAKIEVTA